MADIGWRLEVNHDRYFDVLHYSGTLPSRHLDVVNLYPNRSTILFSSDQ